MLNQLKHVLFISFLVINHAKPFLLTLEIWSIFLLYCAYKMVQQNIYLWQL